MVPWLYHFVIPDPKKTKNFGASLLSISPLQSYEVVFGKNSSGYRLLQVNKIFDNFLWNLFKLICSLLAGFCIYSNYSHPFRQKQFTDRGNFDVEYSAWEEQKKPQHINFLFFILPLGVLERSSWAGFVHCPSSIPWRKITHLSSTWHWSFKLLLNFTLRLTAVTIWVLKASSGKLRSQVISGL